MASVDLALVGNSAVAALIDGQGAVVWWCWPKLDGDPLFCGLLDEPGRGIFGVSLLGQREARIVSPPGAPVVVTRLEAEDGSVLEVVDVVPAGEPAPIELVRTLRPVEGRPAVRLVFDPRAGWGAREATLTAGDTGLYLRGIEPAVHVSTNLPNAALRGEPVALDGPGHVVLSAGPLPGVLAEHAQAALDRTEAWWAAWYDELEIPAVCADVVRPAARALALCTSQATGAIVAALTTSVPEEPGTGRNWDYRYCWLRDAYFVVRALYRLGDRQRVARYGAWLRAIVAASPDGPAAAVRPARRAPPRGALRRGPAGLPRRGAGAHRQRRLPQIQHDVYGQAVLCAILAGDTDYGLLAPLAERAWALWDRPDAGVWEYRAIAHVHTSSAAFCWAALDAVARHAPDGEQPLWRERADHVREQILARAWDPSLGALSGALDGPLLDASVLLLPQLGLVDWQDPRFVATVDVLDRKLLRTGEGHAHMMRYVVADDFGAPHHAFTACSFWAIQALIGVGRLDEAETRFRALLQQRSVAGLLSEDLDTKTGEAWGNYPQTYCSVGLIECALDLAAARALAGVD
ncbi:MAG: glycoside hydrolase family 15 protein [Myxococcota bacterium]